MKNGKLFVTTRSAHLKKLKLDPYEEIKSKSKDPTERPKRKRNQKRLHNVSHFDYRPRKRMPSKRQPSTNTNLDNPLRKRIQLQDVKGMPSGVQFFKYNTAFFGAINCGSFLRQILRRCSINKDERQRGEIRNSIVTCFIRYCAWVFKNDAKSNLQKYWCLRTIYWYHSRNQSRTEERPCRSAEIWNNERDKHWACKEERSIVYHNPSKRVRSTKTKARLIAFSSVMQ